MTIQRKNFAGTSGFWAVAALLAAGLSHCAAPPAGGPPPAARPGGSGKMFGKVSVADAKSLPGGAVITINGRRVQTDTAGNYKVSGLPAGKHAVVAELKTKEKRYLALPFAFIDEKQDLQLDIRLADAGDVDLFCSECHPFTGKQTRSSQVVRDVHPSGLKPVKAVRTTQLLDARGLVTCESCHSLHQETGVERYVLYPFKNGDLCNRCH